MSSAMALLDDSAHQPPANLLPLAQIDELSIACVICDSASDPGMPGAGQVIRWHLAAIPATAQGALIDTDPVSYLSSLGEELDDREKALPMLRDIATRYQEQYVAHGRLPRGWVERPVQLACQNVIIGLSAFAHDAAFDGLRVPAFLTCEVPHLATHEGNRALCALMLCDAYQNGGTMEIRFGTRHRSRTIPPALKRYARTHGILLGSEDPCAILPAESRELFLASTPMPDELWARAVDLMDRGLLTPERICHTLLTPIWSAIELDYILAVSSRAASILAGGSSAELRRTRLVEQEVARAALMAGMLYRRVSIADRSHNATVATVHEDTRTNVNWSIDQDRGYILFSGLDRALLPWLDREHAQPVIDLGSGLAVIPRALPTPVDWTLARSLQHGAAAIASALLVPKDVAASVPADIAVLICPDRLAEIDIEVERRMQRARTSRS
ncbi:MAG: hypothetical protein K1Y02_06115 [Candidatus Hydrogenedentes bacterium]|nr:hypothetical protein [Candidatus Hydrogenedentota bacterium]